jgi:DNA-binding LacI/PurR family transcriptional regulator/signal transduction histidine kinase
VEKGYPRTIDEQRARLPRDACRIPVAGPQGSGAIVSPVSAEAPSHRVIGVFTAQLDDAYQIAVWRGIESRARQRGVGVVCFVGHRVDSPIASEAAANVAYRIADGRNVDGLVVVSSAISTFLDQVGRMFASQPDLPRVSIGLGISGVPSITADGSNGVSILVRHLAQDHGVSRFALIGGPAGHPEAEERECAFRATLRELAIPFDERLAVKGTFLRDSGIEAARQLLRLGLPFDAVVCMNDRMALAAVGALRQAGVAVPGDVAVVGFDGIEEGRYATPPLTTVVQPLDELGSSAVDALLERMEGGRPLGRVLKCTPVIRQSCGCAPKRNYDADLTEPPPTATAEERHAIGDMVEAARNGDADGFIAQFNAALADTALAGGKPGKWNGYLSAIQHLVETQGQESDRTPPGLFEFARVLIGESESRLQAARRIAAEERLATLRAISASLAGAFEMPVMRARLEAGLVELGIGGGYIALFEQRDLISEWSRLVMAPRDARAGELPSGGIRFRTVDLVPPRIGRSWRQGLWVLEPLVFQKEPLGYILLPGGAAEPAVYATLREQVASALKGALLLEQVLTHERRLQVEVARRTAELTRTNRELTQEIERRMRLEQEVIQISNRTMQRIGQDLHDDLCQHLAGIAMLVSVLRSALTGSDPAAVASIEHIGNLLADSITRAKQIARGLYPAGLEEHGIVAAVEELVEAARRTYPAVIDFRASPDFRLPGTDRALHVYRIIQEALSNALKHARSARIEVQLYREESAGNVGAKSTEYGGAQRNSAGANGRRGEGERAAVFVAEVTDYGDGLPKSTTGEGMGLRIMRYRAETAGVELLIERLNPGTRVTCRISGGQGEQS